MAKVLTLEGSFSRIRLVKSAKPSGLHLENENKS